MVRVTRACICGSDLHLYHGLMPDTRGGHTFGHDFVGIVEQVGDEVTQVKTGDRVLAPFNFFCGECYFCQMGLYANCHNVNPQATAVGGIYGYSHTTGGYDGGQAQYVRVPCADLSILGRCVRPILGSNTGEIDEAIADVGGHQERQYP